MMRARTPVLVLMGWACVAGARAVGNPKPLTLAQD